MNTRYSELSQEQLREEIERLEKELAKAESAWQENVIRQKAYMAKSYLMKGLQLPQGTYRVGHEPRTFQLERMNGIMAWGRWDDGEEGAVPIAALLLP
ncbi:DUF1811 family protein [Paenibacillus thermotolerans]|uniref:DUF1811 family protein n=1 Tax=Paenibacillus thermotolerans TaxID=3027807 RepID=UPI002368E72D|nr:MULTISPECIES: DUF1811 family protein [unclassified Paenibacillus]